MTSDLTFITNEEDKNLLNRFATLIKDTRFFDCLEKEIDQLVYKLYALTPEEIAIVENFNKGK